MMDYNQAADALDRMAVQQQAIIDASATFRALGSIEGATREAEARKVKLEQAAVLAQETLDALADKIIAADDTAEQIVSKANEEAGGIVAQANAEAESIRAAAASKAAEFKRITQEQADQLTRKVNADLDSVRDQAAALKLEVAGLREERDALVAETDREQAKLDTIRSTISKFANVG